MTNMRLHLYCVALHCIVLYCITWYCIALHCIASYYTALYFFVLYCFVLYCIVLYCMILHCIVLFCIVLICIVLYCIALHYTVLPVFNFRAILGYDGKNIVLDSTGSDYEEFKSKFSGMRWLSVLTSSPPLLRCQRWLFCSLS